MNDLAWQAHRRPASGTLDVTGLRCPMCGRHAYMTVNDRDWGQRFCRGCDEKLDRCWCPDAREKVEAIP